jgi:hypothetical protein
MCSYFTQSVDELFSHLLRRHKNSANFIINIVSCRSHYYRKHYSEGQTENVLQDQSCSAAETDLADEPDEFSRQDEAAFLLKLKAGHRLSQSATSDIMQSTRLELRCKKFTAS